MSKAPKLRFKEFSGDWEEKKLGTLGQFLKGSTLSKADLSEEGKPCVLYGELYTKYNEVINNVISKTNLENDKLVLGQKNDVLIPSSGETAIDIATASCLQQDNVILGGDLNVFRSDKVNGVFTSYQLNSSKKREIARLSQGASVVHIYNDQLKKIKLSVPSKEEQEKIASFFSLIDYKISLQGEKVEALKDYKRGMMQKIFSRELRFKDDEGRDYPEWNMSKAKDLFESISDKNHNGDLEVLSATQDRGVIPRSELNIDIKFEQDNLVSYKKVKKDDFIISLRSFQGGIEHSAYTGLVSPAYTVFNFKENINFCHKFFAIIFKSTSFINRLNTLTYGIRDGKAISFKDFSDVKLEYPSKEEQEKIAEFFSNIDLKIEKEQEKLDFLNEYKKGLLQQMFV